jgi:hypothetical protein
MARCGQPAKKFPRIALFLQRAGTNRIGVRAFFTLKGYAGRNRRNGVGFARLKRENARPPSWFSSEIGTKTDAKQQNWAFVRVCPRDWRRFATEKPYGAARG